MKRLLIALLLIASTSAFAQHQGRYHGNRHNYSYRHYNGDAYAGFFGGVVVGAIIGPAFRQPPVVVYAPQPVYVPPIRHAIPMQGDTCPIVDGYQMIPMYKYNRHGYPDKVGCAFPQ